MLCNDRATLLWATNLADIEKHVLLARAPELNHPTSLVFDLDPGEPAGVLDCGRIALHLKKLFETWGLESFVKVSGSKGLHLSVPLNGKATYEVTQPFAKTVAELVAHQMPKGVVSEMAKNLRTGKVLIDWSQNSDFKTTVCVYSVRAKSGEPFISMPLTWDELARAVKRADEKRLFFTAEAAVKRIKKLGDLFEPVLKLKQQLPAAFTKALGAGPAPKLSSWPENRDKSLREYTAKRDLSRTPEPAARQSLHRRRCPAKAGARRSGIVRPPRRLPESDCPSEDWRRDRNSKRPARRRPGTLDSVLRTTRFHHAASCIACEEDGGGCHRRGDSHRGAGSMADGVYRAPRYEGGLG